MRVFASVVILSSKIDFLAFQTPLQHTNNLGPAAQNLSSLGLLSKDHLDYFNLVTLIN